MKFTAALILLAGAVNAAPSKKLRASSSAVVNDVEQDVFVEANNRHLLEDDAPCVAAFTTTTTSKEANGYEGCDGEEWWTKWVNKITASNFCQKHGRTPLGEFNLHLGTAYATDGEAIAHLDRMCLEAVRVFQAENEITWPHIVGEETNHFVKELMDGNTDINTGLQTKNVIDVEVGRILDDWGDRFKGVHDLHAKKKVFEMPEEATNFPEEDCRLGAAMCCWVSDRRANDDNGNCATPYYENCLDADPADNTDLCSVDMARAPTSARVAAGTATFPGDTEGDVHCHGFAWAERENHASNIFKGNNLFYVSLYDHFRQRGYVRNVPGGPMCACVDQMPIVSRSDCTEITLNEIRITWVLDSTSDVEVFTNTMTRASIAFDACTGLNGNNNDLEAYYARLAQEGKRTATELEEVQRTLVGTCPA